jgi:NAD(P)H-dependent FMN reductase
MPAKLIFFAGSARKASANKKLAAAAAAMAEDMGAQTTYIDLADYPMPIFCEDYEAENGLPENTKTLKKLFVGHDGFLIASPEYNSSFSPLLKNTLDWMTRPESKDEPILTAFKNKTAALTAASPGALGGLRGLIPLRMWLSNIQIHVIPQQFALGGAMAAFDENGALTDAKQKEMLSGVLQQFIDTTQALKA